MHKQYLLPLGPSFQNYRDNNTISSTYLRACIEHLELDISEATLTEAITRLYHTEVPGISILIKDPSVFFLERAECILVCSRLDPLLCEYVQREFSILETLVREEVYNVIPSTMDELNLLADAQNTLLFKQEQAIEHLLYVIGDLGGGELRDGVRKILDLPDLNVLTRLNYENQPLH